MLKTLTDTATALIVEWQAKKAAAVEAAKAIAEERSARDAVVAHIFEGDIPGTHNYELTDGFKIKATLSLDYKLDVSLADPEDPSKGTKTEAMLDRLEKLGNDGAFIAERVVKFKPELVISEYKKLTAAQKEIVDSVLTIKDAAPSLEMVAPKNKT